MLRRLMCGNAAPNAGLRIAKSAGRGSYYPKTFAENGRLYVRQRGDDSVGRVCDGYVLHISAQEDVVLAYVRRLVAGDRDGWYVLDVKWVQVSGPLSDAEPQSICSIHGITWERAETFWGRRKGLG